MHKMMVSGIHFMEWIVHIVHFHIMKGWRK